MNTGPGTTSRPGQQLLHLDIFAEFLRMQKQYDDGRESSLLRKPEHSTQIWSAEQMPGFQDHSWPTVTQHVVGLLAVKKKGTNAQATGNIHLFSTFY
ncbi:hypothetical protein GJ744_001081 [Endocarpon pusillum]|uniref:Uncharacterized protein n=1 Tax=Endocarpon pusillum TaxID=364733 RepID=A0A8H7AD50_9EURO|nr:hypothetical protein GJ744_001081 [Endocarpon pusillum]